MNKLDKDILILCIESMKICLQEAPIDFLGTGSCSKDADEAQVKWRDKWQSSYIEAKDILKK